MDEVIKSVLNGETIKVSYRNKPAIKIVADENAIKQSNVPAILEAAEEFRSSLTSDARAKLSTLTDAEIKEARDLHMKEKYGA